MATIDSQEDDNPSDPSAIENPSQGSDTRQSNDNDLTLNRLQLSVNPASPFRNHDRFDIPGEMIVTVAVSPNEDHIAAGCASGKIFLFQVHQENEEENVSDFDSLQLLPFQGPYDVRSLSFSPNGKLLVALFARKVFVFDAETGKFKNHIDDIPYTGYSCSFTADSRRIAIGGESGWGVFDVHALPSQIPKFHKEGPVRTLFFYYDGYNDILVVSRASDRGGRCSLYTSFAPQSKPIAQFGDTSLTSAVPSPNQMHLAISYFNQNKMSLYTVHSQEHLHTFSFDGVCSAITFAKKGNRVFVGTRNGKVLGYNVDSYALEYEHSCPSCVFDLTWLEDSKTLVAGCNGEMLVINVGVKKTFQIEHGDRKFMEWRSALSRDGTSFSVGYIVYDTLTMKERWRPQETMDLYEIEYSPSGKRIAGTAHFFSFAWDMETGKTLLQIQGEPFDSRQKPFFYHLNWNDNDHVTVYNRKNKMVEGYNVSTDNSSDVPVFSILIQEADEDDFRAFWDLSISVVPKSNVILVRIRNELKFYDTSEGGNLKAKKTITLQQDQGNILGGKGEGVYFSMEGSIMFVRTDLKLLLYKMDIERALQEDEIQPSSQATSPVTLVEENTYGVYFTQDKTLLILSTKSHLQVFDMDIMEDSDSLPVPIIKVQHDDGNEGDKFQGWKVLIASNDGKVVATMTESFIHTFHLEEIGKGNIHKKIPFKASRNASMIFAPEIDGTKYNLIIHNSVHSFALEVDVSTDVNPILLQRHMGEGGWTDIELREVVANNQYALETCDEYHMKPICLAAKNNNDGVVKYMIETQPTLGCSREIITYLMNKNHMNVLIQVLKHGIRSSTPPDALLKCKEIIEELVTKDAMKIIIHLLLGGSKGCAPGFVFEKKLYKKQNGRPCHGDVLPRAFRSLAEGLQYCEHLEDDEDMQLETNAARVSLPFLSSYSVLQAFLGINRQSLASNQDRIDQEALAPFRTKALQTSIEANWNSWGHQRLLRQQLLYFCWLVSIIALTTRKKWDGEVSAFNVIRIILIVLVVFGCLNFVKVEYMQIKKRLESLQEKKQRQFKEYYYNFWNIWQVLTLSFVTSFVAIELAIPRSNEATLFGALSQFFACINSLYYLRGRDEWAWIVYALLRIIAKMRQFLGILFFIIASTTILFWTMDAFEPSNRLGINRFFTTFTNTFFLAIFGDIDPDDSIAIAATFWAFLLTFIFIMIVIFLICFNAMIAFISEDFATILDDKNAILAREKADMMLDLYCGMSKILLEETEKSNMWTYKLYRKTDLDDMDTDDGENANARRATKESIMRLNAKVNDLKASNDELKASNDSMSVKVSELKESNESLHAKFDELDSLVRKVLKTK